MKSASIARTATIAAAAAIAAKYQASFDTTCDTLEIYIDSAIAKGKSVLTLNWTVAAGRGRAKKDSKKFNEVFTALHEGFFAEAAEGAAEDAPAVLTATGAKMVKTLTDAGYTVSLTEGELKIGWGEVGDVVEATVSTEEGETAEFSNEGADVTLAADVEGFAASMSV